ncbi:MAG: SMC-Scp complex subunit ScpB [Candidatus Omnitrophota bacterium]
MLENTHAVVEAMLFISEKPLTIEQIKDVVDGLDANGVRKVVAELNAGYEESNRGIRITEVAGGFRMITPPALAPFLRKMYKQRRAEKLSKPALETLAIIAYKQPLTKIEIESLRNVNVDGVMSSLLEKGLIRITGRKNAPGRPIVYGTTRQFLEHFGLKSLEDLPKMEDFSEPKIIEEKAEEKVEEKKDEPAKATEGN